VCKIIRKKLGRTLAGWALTSFQNISCIIWTEKGVWKICEAMEGFCSINRMSIIAIASIHYEKLYVLRGSKRGMYGCGSRWIWTLFIYRKKCACHDRLIITHFQVILTLR
jgi:hypothetical protein